MNLPNYLTFARILIVPLLVVILLTPVAEDYFGISGYIVAIVVFLIASLTDILDGHLARRRNQVSTLGKLLDPIADKLLVSAALIVLVEKHLAPAWAVVIILGREFIVTGLRSIAATEGIIIQAQMSGKIKMWAQCVAIVALLVAAAAGDPPVSNFGFEFPTFRFLGSCRSKSGFLQSFQLFSHNCRLARFRLSGRARRFVAGCFDEHLVACRLCPLFSRGGAAVKMKRKNGAE